MQRLVEPIRVLVVASLVMSVGLSAICTPVSAQMLRSAAPKVSPAKIVCCCGGDGSCCGMACCLRKASSQAPTRLPVRTGGETDHSLALGLNLLAAAFVSNEGGQFERASHAVLDGLLVVDTLQSFHIRIQT